jgi:hypothetical protein
MDASQQEKVLKSTKKKMATSAPVKMAGVGNGLYPAAAANDIYRLPLSHRNDAKGTMQ